MQEILDEIKSRNMLEREFIQAVEEVFYSIDEMLLRRADLRKAKILQRMAEPERVIMFRIPWMDDHGNVQVNRGFRVQMNNALGPFKGGMRFHPSVNLSILKFLGFEQTLKNALTSLPLGGGKGGSDFNPRNRSTKEVMRFCQSLMIEMHRHIGPDTDVPAGDIGVGPREIGYMYGMYRKLQNEVTGAFTGKGLDWGGSLLRPEATGYGVVYFAAEMLATKGDSLEGKTCVISGSGNVAQYTAEKLLQMGAKVITFSDSQGFIHDETGVNEEKLEFVKDLKQRRRGRIREYGEAFREGKFTLPERDIDYNPLWEIPCDIAFPCATQNEINMKDARHLAENGCKLVVEGANMPCTPEAVELFKNRGVRFAPGKASNAGGVATSGLEMSQNSMRYKWTREKVDKRLQSIMKDIHKTVVEAGEVHYKKGDYVAGANIAGFLKVAGAMMDHGLV